MNATMLTTLLVATAVAAPAWMLLRKKQGLPFKARWLMTVGLLMAPIFLAKWLAPTAWMDIRTMPDLFWYLTVLPFVLGIAALGGGLLVFLAQILGAFLGAIGSVDWPDYEVDDSPRFNDLINPLDWNNDWIYSFHRNKE
jgi:hypothetical protein